jgi:hypothetical protein
MNRFLKTAAALLAIALLFVGCQKKPAGLAKGKAAFHIGVVTGTASQSGDDLRGAEELIKRYGKAADGGMIEHIAYPDNFMEQQETTISRIVALADDPALKAIVVSRSVPGTVEAFRRVREKRPDILLFAGEFHGDPLVIEAVSDVAVNSDFISRGYTIVWAAKQLGAKTFVHISFPRQLSYATYGLRRQIMEKACDDLGLKFVSETAPDPISNVGQAGTRQFILEKAPQWVQKYGKDTAFFCADDVHTEPLLKQLLAYGGIFVEADLPSPMTGYPGALGIDLSADAGNFPAILKKIEKAIVDKGGAGRFGTWAFSYDFTVTAGLGEFAKNCIEGKTSKDSLQGLFDALAVYTPGAKWNGGYYIDANTGVRAKNHVLVYMDTYVFGKGYLPTTAQKIPEKYYSIKFQQQ